MTDAQY